VLINACVFYTSSHLNISEVMYVLLLVVLKAWNCFLRLLLREEVNLLLLVSCTSTVGTASPL
jgi:hypothetical protein